MALHKARAAPDPGSPAPEFARQGRHNQRYSAEGERLVAGCLPVRAERGQSGPGAVRVLLIGASSGGGLVLPKGGWETDETVQDAARRETVEEAGVRGDIEEETLGQFRYCSAKAGRLAERNPAHAPCSVAYIFVMHVTEELDKWPELHKRTRHWLPIEEACARCKHDWIREVLEAWVQREGWALSQPQPS